MTKTQNICPNCGADVLKVRWDAGYQYCRKKECFDRLGRKAGVTMFETVPSPGEIDINPRELDEVDGQDSE